MLHITLTLFKHITSLRERIIGNWLMREKNDIIAESVFRTTPSDLNKRYPQSGTTFVMLGQLNLFYGYRRARLYVRFTNPFYFYLSQTPYFYCISIYHLLRACHLSEYMCQFSRLLQCGDVVVAITHVLYIAYVINTATLHRF